MLPADARVVEVRVAGTVGPIVCDRFPGFVAAAGAPVTVITGRLDPGEDLTTVLAVLVRHGVQALSSRLYPVPTSTAPRVDGERRP